ncbi:Nif11-like leader peptide family natural product precursor [Teredinibacter turnerae]|uniref:Nif11-like leader peptide family natural product precursor n=1 Tax=Teredinibacter turnerae TaxID=2426 RepID=UPI00036FC978|nr:Nif11-like leader peptide family natural product precursor [Teredinibacter turnerae]
MSLQQIKAFSDAARENPELGGKLKECQKIRDMLTLGTEYGFAMDEVELYPPNEPQFTEDQLSEKLVKALLRV